MKSRTMQFRFGKWLLALALVMPLLVTLSAKADDEALPEARMEGYATAVKLTDPGGSGFSIFCSVFVSLIACGVMFARSGRTHLD